MNRFSHSMLAAGLFSLGAGASAQPPGPSPSGPGALRAPRPEMHAPATRAELQKQLEARFDAMDANHDGTLDGKDPEARRNERIAVAFGRIDRDGDGAISKDEFASAPGPAAGPPPMPRRAMMFASRGPGGPPQAGAMRGPQPFAQPPRSPMPGAPMAHGPEGANGQPVTKSDFVARGLARFDEADTDHDGTLSAAERDAVRGTMRDRRERAKLPASRSNPQPPGQ